MSAAFYFQSVIITVLNGSKWIGPCFESILRQTGSGDAYRLEVCVFDDASTDSTWDEAVEWVERFQQQGHELVLLRSEFDHPMGGR